MAVSKVELLVLGLLDDGAAHGYDLLERMRDRSMGFWVEVGKASVYQALQRLERKGHVGGRAEPGTDGPDRRVYRLTRTGRVRLREGMRERFGVLTPYETPAGEALAFLPALPAPAAREALAAREEAILGFLDALATETVRTAGVTGAPRAVANALLQRQRVLAEAELAWVRSAKGSLGRLRR